MPHKIPFYKYNPHEKANNNGCIANEQHLHIRAMNSDISMSPSHWLIRDQEYAQSSGADQEEIDEGNESLSHL